MPNWRAASIRPTSGSCSAPGIRERHVAAEGEFTSHLAIKAARAALHHARLDAQAIDLIVLATSTPDNTFPATAVAVQDGPRHPSRRRLRPAGGLLGFVFALATADNFLRPAPTSARW
jgi:3-oxoacyl-[acyl-carrier-protein] synthase-3